MPMSTIHTDVVAPTITQSGAFTTIRWDRGLSIQLDSDEWAALVDAVRSVASEPTREITRNEQSIRDYAEIREALQ